MTTTFSHLGPNNYIDSIGLSLDENMYGANGELSEEEVHALLMESIVETCNHYLAGPAGTGDDFIPVSVAEHEFKPAVTLHHAASMIIRVWKHGDRKLMDMMFEPDRRRIMRSL
jgi:hypothetical protein